MFTNSALAAFSLCRSRGRRGVRAFLQQQRGSQLSLRAWVGCEVVSVPGLSLRSPHPPPPPVSWALVRDSGASAVSKPAGHYRGHLSVSTPSGTHSPVLLHTPWVPGLRRPCGPNGPVCVHAHTFVHACACAHRCVYGLCSHGESRKGQGIPEAGLCSRGELPACRQGRLRPGAQVWPLSPRSQASGQDAGEGVRLRVWAPCDDSVWVGDRQAVALGSD